MDGLEVLLQLLGPPGSGVQLRLGALLLTAQPACLPLLCTQVLLGAGQSAALQHKWSRLWVWPHVLLAQ